MSDDACARADLVAVDSTCRRRGARRTIVALLAGVATLLRRRTRRVDAAEMMARPAAYPWESEGLVKSHDHAAIRRGWLVYKTVCRACHSVKFLRFGDLVDVSHTEREVKAIAAEYEVEDGPDEFGNYYSRPAGLNDRVPSPYPNDEAARTANFGASPPDLTYLIPARPNGRNYVYSLLTGYVEPPAGVHLDDGQHFNPYFDGGCIAMPQMLHDDAVEYDDGTQASVSQMSKDLVEFLSWTSSQEHDARKVLCMRGLGIATILILATWHTYRRNWSYLRSRQIASLSRRKR